MDIRWIQFSDMKPPIGMYILVIIHGSIAILRWKKEYEEDDTQFIELYDDEYGSSHEIFELDGWAPCSSFDQYRTERRFSFEPEDDWYVYNRNHPNVKKIKQITDELSQKSDEKLYTKIKIQEISELFFEINDGRNIINL